MRRRKTRRFPIRPNDELRAEAEEAKPEVYFVVYDESGAAIRRVDGSTEAGFQRVAWDLRYPAAQLVKTFRQTAKRISRMRRIRGRWCFREIIRCGCLRKSMEW